VAGTDQSLLKQQAADKEQDSLLAGKRYQKVVKKNSKMPSLNSV
jgi:hypothetical protein